MNCTFCNDTGCPACTGWPDPADTRWLCKGCGKRRYRPLAHHSKGELCGPWLAPGGMALLSEFAREMQEAYANAKPSLDDPRW